ncbi:hypothetical protein SPBR_04881 [Sporothrix brasiliensis 5110]|uniref:EGF domain-specific O-linked N-acetylglucosamine transferase n=1 Tax=Sporothrix brasiliensis 5110 TaxID=1398154 RepID=A0A0C2ILB8_9PEZI|nr:uncharacterized protein SPBR_04881 [Sporothrix brasiliensis 5110]KIH87775.1 hypothetical protein SPBR_04881 [Sporothrix brasiliensis 5110]
MAFASGAPPSLRLLVFSRRRVLYVAVAFVLTLVVYFLALSDRATGFCASCLPAWRPSPSAPSASPPGSGSASPEPLTLPDLDTLPPPPPGRDVGYCRQHFSSDYLSDLRDHSIQYCEGNEHGPAQSRLTCFHGHIRDDHQADSFCIASGASWDATTQKFQLGCPVWRTPNENETAGGLIPFTDLAPYWFNTGPKTIFKEFVSMTGAGAAHASKARAAADGSGTPSFVLLVKREGAGNLWHCLMEIWSMTMTMDVLRMARPDDRAAPFYATPMDVDNTHVVLLDDHGPGPTLDLWRLFSRHPLATLKDMTADPAKVPAPLLRDGASHASLSSTHLVVPLPGGSNPLWHNDWAVRDCQPGDAPLLHLFVQRVFAHLDVPRLAGPKTDQDGAEPIVVTFIDRRGTRRLLNGAALLAALPGRFPGDAVVVQSIDMATLSLADQVRLVQDTDVLVGVHGAGLTHTMFMRRGAGAVVEIQPTGLAYKGFRNLAAMTGQHYFSAEAEMVAQGDGEDEHEDGEKAKGKGSQSTGTRKPRKRNDPPKVWQASNVRMEEDRFLALMDVAIKSVYNEGLRNKHVVK